MTRAPPNELLDLIAIGLLPKGRHEEAPAAAIRAMEAGLNSLALWAIAGFSGPTDSFELESLVRRMLDEMQLDVPDHATLVRALARPMARQFLAGEVLPGKFAEALYDLSQLDRGEAHHPWCQLHDEWLLASDGVWGDEEPLIAALRSEAERILSV